MAVLPTPLNDCGPRIVVYRYLYPPEKYAMEEIIEICFATVESLIMTDPYACICGIVYILDMSQITLEHLRQYTAHMVKKIVAFYEKCIPLRTKSFCYINVPSCAEEFFKLFLFSLSAELREKVSFGCTETV